MRWKSWTMLFVFLLLPLAGGFWAGQAVRANLDWYGALQKPWFTPPSWIFAPVWSVLYVLMGIAAWRMWTCAGLGRALIWWFVQLVLNLIWTPVFFGLHRPDLAMAALIALWATLVPTVQSFWQEDRTAGRLLIPYLVWTGFAGLLNAAIWSLN